MIVSILGLIDIIAGILIIFPSSSMIAFYIAIFCLIKGIISVPSLLEGEILIFLLGLIDILSFFSLILTPFGIQILKIVGYLMVLKGIYSVLTGMF